MAQRTPHLKDPDLLKTTVSGRNRIEPIPDTPENIARAIMRGPPKKEWRYLKGDPADRDRSSRS